MSSFGNSDSAIMIEEGSVRRTIHIALKDMGDQIGRIRLQAAWTMIERSASRKRADNRVQEFVWAFGSDAEAADRKADL